MEAYKHFVGPHCNYLKKVEQQAKKIFSLQMHPTLIVDEQNTIIQELKELLN